jgi:hypothetical protein
MKFINKTGQIFDRLCLRPGGVRSCGCLRDEAARKRMTKHGMKRTRENAIWMNMRARCGNPNHQYWADYGGRGIVVCERWQTFMNFFADMGRCPEKHTIERVDNDRGYEPENCRWATMLEQGRNKRNNRLLTMGGESHHAAEWARRVGINAGAILYRKRAGWTDEEALTTPVAQQRKRKSRSE